MKTFIITVSGQTEVDIYNAISHVNKLIHKQQLNGEGTLIRGFLEGAGKFNFKSYGEYENVLPKEVEQYLKEAEALLEKSDFYFEDRHDFEVQELSQEEKNNYETQNPKITHSIESPVKRIIFHIIVSGQSQYAVDKFLNWVYNKVSQGTLFHKLSHITMLPEKISGYCSIESFGKYQSTFDSIASTEDENDENYYDNENNDTYCSACQQDPCECSDREKTSTVHDF